MIEIYSEKLNTTVKISDSVSDEQVQTVLEDTNSSLVGWSHGGWNNDNGGGSTW